MFQYIQEYTGLVSPGILAVFIMGLFWKKTTTKAAIYGVLSSIVIALLLKVPSWSYFNSDVLYLNPHDCCYCRCFFDDQSK